MLQGAPAAAAPLPGPPRLPTSVCPLASSPANLPAAHAACSAAGLSFISLWLLGRLRCFTVGGAQPARLVAALSPLFVVGAVGVTDVRLNRHHVADVLAGEALGTSLAVAFFLQAFASPIGARTGCLVGEDRMAAAAAAGEQQAEAAGYLPVGAGAEEAAP